MQLKDILSASIVGNIVGIVSLLVGIISLIWTVITYRKTKEIEKKLPDAQAKAINKKLFKDYRSNAIKTLHSRQSAAKNAGKISKKACNDIITICNRIKGYSDELLKEDYGKVDTLYMKLVPLMQDKKILRDEDMVVFIEVTSGLISILERGEYDL